MFGATWAREDLRKILAALGARFLTRSLVSRTRPTPSLGNARRADPELEHGLRLVHDRLASKTAPAAAA
jgi:hypothetical protein